MKKWNEKHFNSTLLQNLYFREYHNLLRIGDALAEYEHFFIGKR